MVVKDGDLPGYKVKSHLRQIQDKDWALPKHCNSGFFGFSPYCQLFGIVTVDSEG